MNTKLSLLGCVVLASMTCSVSAQTAPQPATGAPCAPGPKGAGHRGMLGEKLGLTDEQKSKIAPLVQKNRADIKAIRENPNLAKDQKHQQIAAIHQAMDQQMKSILTPEQYQKWQAIKAEKKEQRQEKKNRQAT